MPSSQNALAPGPGLIENVRSVAILTVHSLALALGIVFGLSEPADSHSGIVDGYGCHRGPDKTSYHCHQGQFVGRTFKSREDFLRELREGKSQRLAPKSNQPPFEKKADE